MDNEEEFSVERLLEDSKAMDEIIERSKQIERDRSGLSGMGSSDLEIAKNIYAEYKRLFRPAFPVPAYHKCWPSTCKMFKVEGCVRESTRFDRAEEYHFCFFDQCPEKYERRCHDGAIIKDMRGLIFVCEISGRPHYCGSMCDRMGDAVNSDFTEICPISGRVSVNEEMKGEYWMPYGETETQDDVNTSTKRVSASESNIKFIDYAMQNASDMNIYNEKYPKSLDAVFPGLSRSGSVDITAQDPPTSTLSASFPMYMANCMRRVEICMKNKYMRVAIEKISAMMSDFAKKRYEKYNEDKKKTSVALSLAKYERKSTKAAQPLSACQIRDIVTSNEDKVADMPNITISKSKKNGMIVWYAKQALQFWVILVSNKDKPIDKAKVPFFHFVDAYVKLACSGLHVNTSGINSREWVLEQDILLASLVSCEICPEVCDDNRSNKVKAFVNNYVHDLVYNFNVSPESLSPSRIDYNYIQESSFVPLRTPSAYSSVLKKKNRLKTSTKTSSTSSKTGKR